MSIRNKSLITALIDVIALVIENYPTKISSERLRELLGPNPVLPKVLSSNPATTTATEKSHRATPPGVSEEHYCLDCASKHLGTAKVLMREALQRAEKGESPELVLAKVRGAYEELLGAEDDTQAISDERIRALNSKIRDLRKWFFDSGILAEADKKLIAEAFKKVTELNDEVYKELELRKAKLREFLTKIEEKVKQMKEQLGETHAGA